MSDRQIDALLGDAAAPSEDLQEVADLLIEIQAVAVPGRDADFSALFAAAARESRVTPLERFADEHFTASEERRAPLLQRVAIVGVAVWAFVAMSTGLAHAANGAKPGDLLYGLDRAFEAIGIGNGGAEERLAESLDLIAAGVEPTGLFQASETVSSTPTSVVAPTTGSDDPGDALAKPELSEEPQEPSVADDPGEDEESEESIDSEEGSTAPTGPEPTNEPLPDESDESTATDEPEPGDSTDPTEDPSEIGDETTESVPDDESGDPTDPNPEPPVEPPPAETPGADERLHGVIGELDAIVKSNPGSPLADKVEDAAAKATTALEELEKTPPDNQAAAGNIEGAIGDLEAAVADGLLDPKHGKRLVDQLAGIISKLELEDD